MRQLFENKLQYIFSQVRDEYEQQCGHLITSIERDINQMNRILQDVSNKFDSSPLITNDLTSFLIDKLQHIDVINKNLEHDWQMMTETGSKIFKENTVKFYLSSATITGSLLFFNFNDQIRKVFFFLFERINNFSH